MARRPRTQVKGDIGRIKHGATQKNDTFFVIGKHRFDVFMSEVVKRFFLIFKFESLFTAIVYTALTFQSKAALHCIRNKASETLLEQQPCHLPSDVL